jgi:HK97 family phage portal protein
MSLLSRIIAPFIGKTAVEGEFRPGPYWTSEGWLPAGAPWNYWQLGIDGQPLGACSSMVEACVSAYAQTIAMCPGDHWLTHKDGGRERIPPARSDLARIIRQPNAYCSISDFLLNLTRELYETGNAYALALRTTRGDINELHLMRSRMCSARIAVDGSIFYDLAGNEVVDRMVGGANLLGPVPSRDVLHVRLSTRRHTLVGESPLLSAMLDVGLEGAMKGQQLRFFQNGGRPSAVLTTDQKLDKVQADQIRDRWNEQSKGMMAGGVPILSSGLKVQDWAQTSVDSQLAETLKISDQSIALAFRVPLAILGIGGQTFASTEMLMRSWIASGLGFALNHIEEAFGNLFGLLGQPEEYLELNTEALLRSAFKERIEGLVAGVHGGIFAPNEARRQEGLPAAEEGDEPRLQQQDVPLTWWKDQRALDEKKAKAAADAAQAAADAAKNPPPQPALPPAASNPPPAAAAAKTFRDVLRLERAKNA